MGQSGIAKKNLKYSIDMPFNFDSYMLRTMTQMW